MAREHTLNNLIPLLRLVLWLNILINLCTLEKTLFCYRLSSLYVSEVKFVDFTVQMFCNLLCFLKIKFYYFVCLYDVCAMVCKEVRGQLWSLFPP